MTYIQSQAQSILYPRMRFARALWQEDATLIRMQNHILCQTDAQNDEREPFLCF